MRTAVVVFLAFGVLAPAPESFAAAPGFNLTWANCSSASSSSRFCFPCDANDVTRSMIASFRPSRPVPDFVGVSVTIDCTVSAPAVPPWWQTGPGECREGALGVIQVSGLSACTNPYAGASQDGGMVVDPNFYPHRFRIRADWARDSAIPILADTLYAGLVIRMTTEKAMDEGFGTCEGCGVETVLVLNQVMAFGLNTGAETIDGPDFQNEAYYQAGGLCATPARTSTWGAVKALYR